MPLIEITMIEGRSAEQKKEMMAGITDVVERTAGVSRQAIRIAIREIPPQHWAIGGIPLEPAED